MRAEPIRDAVRKLLAEWDESLHLASPEYWRIEGVADPLVFFKHLPVIFPYGMTLLIEGLEMSRTAKALYGESSAHYTRKVACDTLIPTPDSYHVTFSAEFADQLCRLIKLQGCEAAFYHFKGYSEREVVFTFHDAFEGELVISSSVPEMQVQEFAKALGGTAERAAFVVDMHQQLIGLNHVLNPPWWRRVLRMFERKKT